MKIKKILVLVFVFAFLIRLIGLSQSLWLDEATTARVTSQYGFRDIIKVFSPTDFHPPLYYLVIKGWTSIVGYSEVALRIPSVIFSLLSGWAIYLIGKKMRNESTGLWACMFFLFNPLIIYYSQEARMYMMVTFFLTTIFYYLICSNQYFLGGELAHNKSAQTSTTFRHIDSSLILGNLFIFLSLWTFYGSIFFITALYLYLVINRRFRTILLLAPGVLIAIAVGLPLFVQQFTNSQIATASVANWRQVLGPASLKNLILISIKFTSGRVTFEPKRLYYLISGVWMIFVFYFSFYFVISKGFKRLRDLIKRDFSLFRSFEMTLVFLFFIPIVLGFTFSFFTPLLQYFRFLYLIPLLSLLLALGATKQVYRVTLLVGFFIWSSMYLLNPNNYREDWKSLTKSLKTKEVYMIPSSSDPLLYYDSSKKINDLKKMSVPEDKKSIVVIPYTADIHGLQYENTLIQLGFHRKSKVAVRQLFYELWIR